MNQTITKEKNGHKVTIDSKEEFICINTRGYELNLSFEDFESLANFVTELLDESIDSIMFKNQKSINQKVGLTFEEAKQRLLDFSKSINKPIFPEIENQDKKPKVLKKNSKSIDELRDEFAGLALNGLCSDEYYNQHSEVMAQWSYSIANEMLKEREKHLNK